MNLLCLSLYHIYGGALPMSICDHPEIDFVQKVSVLENLSECTLLNKAK